MKKDYEICKDSAGESVREILEELIKDETRHARMVEALLKLLISFSLVSPKDNVDNEGKISQTPENQAKIKKILAIIQEGISYAKKGRRLKD